ncbi:MAG: hypothetical protein E7256_05030 [Lachnospiraceae bacterium]|nr:hypothetical protein [Lachnospiraceae bacterium]
MKKQEIKTDGIPNPPPIKRKGKHSRLGDYLVIGIFLVLIYGFTVASLLSPEKGFSENENRVLASKPDFTVDALFDGTYATKYETYVTDQFVLRDSWISIKTGVERMMLKRDINGVYFAKDGYLIEKLDEEDINKDQMNKNITYLTNFIQKYASILGEDRVHAMIVPTAYEILTDKLPAFATGFDQDTLLDAIQSVLGANFVDTRSILRAHADDYIYYRTDHHWTVKGAYLAYTEWAKASGFTPWSEEDFTIRLVSSDFLGTIYSKVNTKVTPDDMYIYDTDESYTVEYNMDKIKHDTLYALDRLETKDKYTVYLTGNNALVEINSTVTNGRNLLIIKDSYAHCFAPFAANHYENVYMIDFRYFNMPVSSFIESNNITDILVLYNASSFLEDRNIYNLSR